LDGTFFDGQSFGIKLTLNFLPDCIKAFLLLKTIAESPLPCRLRHALNALPVVDDVALDIAVGSSYDLL